MQRKKTKEIVYVFAALAFLYGVSRSILLNKIEDGIQWLSQKALKQELNEGGLRLIVVYFFAFCATMFIKMVNTGKPQRIKIANIPAELSFDTPEPTPPEETADILFELLEQHFTKLDTDSAPIWAFKSRLQKFILHLDSASYEDFSPLQLYHLWTLIALVKFQLIKYPNEGTGFTQMVEKHYKDISAIRFTTLISIATHPFQRLSEELKQQFSGLLQDPALTVPLKFLKISGMTVLVLTIGKKLHVIEISTPLIQAEIAIRQELLKRMGMDVQIFSSESYQKDRQGIIDKVNDLLPKEVIKEHKEEHDSAERSVSSVLTPQEMQPVKSHPSYDSGNNRKPSNRNRNGSAWTVFLNPELTKIDHIMAAIFSPQTLPVEQYHDRRMTTRQPSIMPPNYARNANNDRPFMFAHREDFLALPKAETPPKTAIPPTVPTAPVDNHKLERLNVWTKKLYELYEKRDQILHPNAQEREYHLGRIALVKAKIIEFREQLSLEPDPYLTYYFPEVAPLVPQHTSLETYFPTATPAMEHSLVLKQKRR